MANKMTSEQARKTVAFRWAKTTPEERSEYARKMVRARNKKYGWKHNKENMSQVSKDVQKLGEEDVS